MCRQCNCMCASQMRHSRELIWGTFWSNLTGPLADWLHAYGCSLPNSHGDAQCQGRLKISMSLSLLGFTKMTTVGTDKTWKTVRHICTWPVTLTHLQNSTDLSVLQSMKSILIKSWLIALNHWQGSGWIMAKIRLCQSVCMFDCLSVCLSAHLDVCQAVWLSDWLSGWHVSQSECCVSQLWLISLSCACFWKLWHMKQRIHANTTLCSFQKIQRLSHNQANAHQNVKTPPWKCECCFLCDREQGLHLISLSSSLTQWSKSNPHVEHGHNGSVCFIFSVHINKLCNPMPWCNSLLRHPVWRHLLHHYLTKQLHQHGQNTCYQKLRPAC